MEALFNGIIFGTLLMNYEHIVMIISGFLEQENIFCFSQIRPIIRCFTGLAIMYFPLSLLARFTPAVWDDWRRQACYCARNDKWQELTNCMALNLMTIDYSLTITLTIVGNLTPGEKPGQIWCNSFVYRVTVSCGAVPANLTQGRKTLILANSSVPSVPQ